MRDLARQAERLLAIRLRTTINTHLEDQDITTPAAIGAAAALQAVAERLELDVVPLDTDLLRRKERAR